MPFVLKYKCSSCGSTVRWVYDEGTVYPDHLRGCPGQNCIALQEIHVDELTKEEIEEFGWDHLDLDW